MRIPLFILFLLISTFSSAQNTKFNIKYSEPLAVLVFMQNLSENYRSNVYKTEFENSTYNTPYYKGIISKLDSLNIDYSYSFYDYPYDTKTPMQTRDLLKKYLMETNSLEEFKLRAIGILPNKTLSDLTHYISVFTPVYNEIIYNPNKQQFEKQLSEITQYAKEHNIEDFFKTGILFYNATWDNSIPFEIAFYPLPKSQTFRAQAFYNNFICAIQTNLNDYKDLFSVMLHETYHIIYDEQSLEVKIAIDSYFRENPSKNSTYAKLLLNETLATALGNGYVFETLNGTADTNDWYYHHYIDQLARKIYPLLKDYIIQKKSMDKNFIDNYIKIYDENFPNWINELENIMTYRYIISENPNDFNTIRQKYWYCSNGSEATELNESSIDKMANTPVTKFIVVAKNHKERLQLLKKKFKELKNWKYNANSDFSYKILLEDKTQLIILNQKKLTLEQLIENLK